ncbi:MAG TPA: hypothetical protein VF499_12685 [Afipia sp.]
MISAAALIRAYGAAGIAYVVGDIGEPVAYARECRLRGRWGL